LFKAGQLHGEAEAKFYGNCIALVRATQPQYLYNQEKTRQAKVKSYYQLLTTWLGPSILLVNLEKRAFKIQKIKREKHDDKFWTNDPAAKKVVSVIKT
jgi:hypothetical protein